MPDFTHIYNDTQVYFTGMTNPAGYYAVAANIPAPKGQVTDEHGHPLFWVHERSVQLMKPIQVEPDYQI